jgi:hypothetical protein
MDRKAIKFRLSPREIEENRRNPGPDPLSMPWGQVDVVSSNCPKHTGARMARIDDTTYQCSFGHELYHQHGSMTRQNVRDRYDQGFVIDK